MSKEAPAPKAAIARRAHQPTRDCFPMCDQRLRTTRGGVIARVWRSIRQKSNRPLRSMQVPINGATAICYQVRMLIPIAAVRPAPAQSLGLLPSPPYHHLIA